MNNYFKHLQNQYNNPKQPQEKGLIFLSETNMNGKILTPRIPKNFLTDNGFEDNKTKRVCFTQSIDNCLLSLSINCKNKMFYVHTPVGNYSVYYPTRAQVPDVDITREIWVCEPVELKCLGKILVIDRDGLPGRRYTYGNGLMDELFGWKWKYIV
jgi:hypothetical protein